MEIHAYTETINNLLATNKKYVIPRFQRNYSWKKEQIDAFMDDICENIKVENGKCVNQEYFIGVIVLIGEKMSPTMQIVDGQQRLTSITILLSALIENFKGIGKDQVAKTMYEQFIEGKDLNGDPFFKLTNETEARFFILSIQNYEKEQIQAETDEDKLMLTAYKDFANRLSMQAIFEKIEDSASLNGDDNEKYLAILTAIRAQVLDYLKIIYVTVKEEDDAYTIFETLNARGINLSVIDLIKNELFQNLPNTHPIDEAKAKWQSIGDTLIKRGAKPNINSFFRHFWISNYSFTQEDKIYRTFKKRQRDRDPNRKIDAADFFDSLCKSAKHYLLITNPEEKDWPQPEEKPICEILRSFDIFNVTQTRTLILCLIDLKKVGLITTRNLISALELLENFHFQFTAICSMRASGLEGKYSSTARYLRSLGNDKTKIAAYLENDLKPSLVEKLPTEVAFSDGLAKLSFKDTNDKKIIQYIFDKYERYLQKTTELKPQKPSLEHIANQSDEQVTMRQSIGNILPLCHMINEEAGNGTFKDKLCNYRRSQLNIVKNFVAKYEAFPSWGDKEIEQRTQDLAKVFYTEVWKIK
ncbi:MAG: DUF262 domain-containing HNH endonuclease family protein [Alphaproteobacteria bacterium]|nr:DUF262 domain-containing HNH endonuclease family protein [Alphaproteobacteria bacterium]